VAVPCNLCPQVPPAGFEPAHSLAEVRQTGKTRFPTGGSTLVRCLCNPLPVTRCGSFTALCPILSYGGEKQGTGDRGQGTAGKDRGDSLAVPCTL